MASAPTSVAAPMPAAAPPSTAPAAPSAAPSTGGNAAVSTGYSSTPAPSSYGSDITNAVTRLTSYAQQKMTETQNEISSLFNSEGGPIDAARLQVYSQRMSMYEMSMQMAAKLQEKEERAISVWTQP